MAREKSKYDASGGVFTFSGAFIHPLKPDPELIRIEDIAHSLANQCRFTGHVRKFYSTAQHSVYVSRIVPAEWKLWGLLHDASEYLMSDIASPVKWQTEFGKVYREAEDAITLVICERFGLRTDLGTKPPEVARADKLTLWAEVRDLMPMDPPEGAEAWETQIRPWLPEEAEARFLDQFNELT